MEALLRDVKSGKYPAMVPGEDNKYVQEMKAKFEAPSNIKVINTKELNDKQSNVDRKTGSRPRN